MMDKGFIKLYRSLLNWQWYDEPNTLRLYLHLLLTVNIADTPWHGIVIKRGSRVASVAKLAEELGQTPQQTRTAISHLELTNDVTKSSTPKYTVFTVVNYDRYQSYQQGKQQTNNKQTTRKLTSNVTNKQQQYKNNKKYIRNLEESGDASGGVSPERPREKSIYERMRE